MGNDSVCRLFFFLALSPCLLYAISQDHHIFLPTDSLSSSAASCLATDPNLNYKPVIGILSHPGDGASGRLSNATGVSYIAASYVKFVESGGARVIPLLYNDSPQTLIKKLDLVNGVLFTGGWATSGVYLETLKNVFEKALEKNDAGDHFPTFAINLGGNLVIKIVSELTDILETFNASSLPSSLQLGVNANAEGSLFERFPPDLLTQLETNCLVLHNHRYAISPSKLQNNANLASFFEILTTSKDKDDKTFVSTARGKKYPVTVSLWHPEKNAFEWATSLKAPHTEDAVRVTQSTANFFVREARKSSNTPDAQEVRDNLIYNFKPTYGGTAGKGYDEVYLFE
ncbi:gamma-glutamyl hydrolase [Cajanus cajan]|uniref:folate gamma-glutamyl hydrolase n=1 Tax=Cajanus cajan TaxID=3821 RepID=A0A151S977_CAJCA|nr:gamma-glutamyl hydrolase [Cajanus cajan]KYP51329.1 Gamma-glutamyl hydrolase [Cajanus cajan]